MLNKIAILLTLILWIACNPQNDLEGEENATTKDSTNLYNRCVPIETISSESKVDIFFPGDTINGFAKATKLSEEWSASGTGGFLNKGTSSERLILQFNTYLNEYNENHIKERLLFIVLNYESTCYSILNNFEDNNMISIYSQLDADILENVYFVNEAMNNKIEITEIDTIQGFVKGNFAVSFLRDTNYEDAPPSIDSLRFFNGEFEVDIID